MKRDHKENELAKINKVLDIMTKFDKDELDKLVTTYSKCVV